MSFTLRRPDRYVLAARASERVLRACLFRHTRNSCDVEELLQEVYERLFIEGKSDKPEIHDIGAFALRVARNVAFDWLRHQRVVPIELVADMETLEILDESASIEDTLSSQQELQTVINSARTLPTSCRHIFTLCKVYGYTTAEIALRLNISENTVKDHLKKAMRRVANPFVDTGSRRFLSVLQFIRRRRHLS
jgi:RNA polymerase sigma factor (sigma-70 family)